MLKIPSQLTGDSNWLGCGSIKKRIVLLKNFEKTLNNLLAKKKLAVNDFEEFKQSLAETPDLGDVITGTGGIRKTRLKSVSKGKSGGFRVCYLNDAAHNEIFLILIYAKNVQEELTPSEKKQLKELATKLKAR